MTKKYIISGKEYTKSQEILKEIDKLQKSIDSVSDLNTINQIETEVFNLQESLSEMQKDDTYPEPSKQDLSAVLEQLREILDILRQHLTDDEEPEDEDPNEYPYPSEKGKIIQESNGVFVKSFDY
jgi:hypothetical protein